MSHPLFTLDAGECIDHGLLRMRAAGVRRARSSTPDRRARRRRRARRHHRPVRRVAGRRRRPGRPRARPRARAQAGRGPLDDAGPGAARAAAGATGGDTVARTTGEGTMCRILLLYETDAPSGSSAVAGAVARGAEAAGAEVRLRPLAEAGLQDIAWADALALGIEGRGATLPVEAKRWLDGLGFSGWRAFRDKPGCVFAGGLRPRPGRRALPAAWSRASSARAACWPPRPKSWARSSPPPVRRGWPSARRSPRVARRGSRQGVLASGGPA
ncbi:MAG: hypothetical protein U5K43_10630 [Halofilum sp. (in: g-proteobacteria)]|nr:hypothetical protein [Halofilum sp. (in: g-proteobacteria)]